MRLFGLLVKETPPSQSARRLAGFFVSPDHVAIFFFYDGNHRHRQRHHRTADPQGAALALFLK